VTVQFRNAICIEGGNNCLSVREINVSTNQVLDYESKKSHSEEKLGELNSLAKAAARIAVLTTASFGVSAALIPSGMYIHSFYSHLRSTLVALLINMISSSQLIAHIPFMDLRLPSFLVLFLGNLQEANLNFLDD